MKTLKEMIEVMQAALEGKPIEFLGSCDDWRPMNTACAVWNWYSCDYRIAPAPAPDEIDWDLFADNWEYMARDEDGSVFLYEKTPVKDSASWIYHGQARRIDGLFKNIYKQGNLPWGGSLVRRQEIKK